MYYYSSPLLPSNCSCFLKCFPSLNKVSVRLQCINNEDLCVIIVGLSAYNDHKPENIMKSLKFVVESMGELDSPECNVCLDNSCTKENIGLVETAVELQEDKEPRETSTTVETTLTVDNQKGEDRTIASEPECLVVEVHSYL